MNVDHTILHESSSGNSSGLAGEVAKLLNETWLDLRRLAGSLMLKERHNHSLSPSGLVSEAVLQFLKSYPSEDFADGMRLFSLMAIIMRNILIDHSRRRDSDKRGGSMTRVNLQLDQLEVDATPELEVIEIREALQTLNEINRRASVVTSLWLLGHTIPEIAETLGLSKTTIETEWRFARAWMHVQLKGEASPENRME